jgi:hypothetical protein
MSMTGLMVILLVPIILTIIAHTLASSTNSDYGNVDGVMLDPLIGAEIIQGATMILLEGHEHQLPLLLRRKYGYIGDEYH